MKPQKPSYEETQKELRIAFDVGEGNEKKTLLEVFPHFAEMTAGKFAHFIESFWQTALESVLRCEFQSVAWRAFWIGMATGGRIMLLLVWFFLIIQKF